MTPVAWVLNLDAENELEMGHAVTPSRALRAVLARERRRLLGSLVAPGDVVVDATVPADSRARGLPGMAWSPTPGALAQLSRAGARPVPTPATAVLATVNARPFAARVRAELAGDSFSRRIVTTTEAAAAALADPAPDGWLVRRAFGAAGRGRRRIAAGTPTAEQRAWLTAGLRRGPLVIEPWVDITREYTRSAWLTRDGTLTVSPPCRQSTTPGGAWRETETATRDRATGSDDGPLEAALRTAGAALADAGYFGPFGIDAFRHRVPGRRTEVLNPLGEINARFTMDWTTAMGPSIHRPTIEPVRIPWQP